MTTNYSLTDLSDGRWRVRAYTGRTIDGRRERPSKRFTASSRRKANQFAQDWADQVTTGHRHGVGTVGALAEQWLTNCDTRLKPETVRGYRHKTGNHIIPQLGAVKLADLDRPTMAAWFDRLQGSQASQNHLVTIMRTMVTWGWKRGLVTTLDALAPLETTTRNIEQTPAPDHGDVRALLTFLRREDRFMFALVLLAVTTGARRGELLALRRRNFNADVGSMRVDGSWDLRVGLVDPKTKRSRRTIALDPVTVEVVETHLAAVAEAVERRGLESGDDMFLFPSPVDASQPWSPDAVGKLLRRRVDQAGLPVGSVRLHGLRHLSITELADSGIASKVIADRHGHNKVDVTESVYMDRLGRMDRQAAGVMHDMVRRMLDL